MRVEEFLETSARQFPEKEALICDNRRWSYQEIDEKSSRLAHALLSHGLNQGDRIAVCLENSAETVISVFAILKMGGVFVILNPTIKSDKLTVILNNSGSRSLITNASKISSIKPGISGASHLVNLVVVGDMAAEWDEPSKACFCFGQLLEQFADYGQIPFSEKSANGLAALIYTSGSTGVPKGVTMTHFNMVSAASSIISYLKMSHDDIVFNVLPLSFDYGLYQILMSFKIGATVVLERSFAYPHPMIEKMVKEKVTGFPVVPTILAILLQVDLSKYNLSSLRYMTNTGAFLPTPYIARVRELFPQIEIFSMYGLTECKRVAYLPPDQIDHRPESVGKAMPNVEVFIVDDAGIPLPPGSVGELVVRGPNVMQGYWQMPEETEKVLRPGWQAGEKLLYSGDLFRTDEEGYLYFVGRKDDIIKTRGEKVSPREIENILYGMEDVAEAVVISVPDEILGEAIKAIIVPRSDSKLTEKGVQYYCRQKLEDFMVPKYVEMRESLPKTDTGKIRRR